LLEKIAERGTALLPALDGAAPRLDIRRTVLPLDNASDGVALQIDILVLERSPDALDEDLCVTPSYSGIMRARGCCERSLLTCRYLYDRFRTGWVSRAFGVVFDSYFSATP
jgi:hypothetical protein